MAIILDSVISMEEFDVTTDKLLKVIESLILATEAHDNKSLEDKLNCYYFDYQLEVFHNDLKNLFKKFTPDPEWDFKSNFSINEPLKALRVIMDIQNCNREEAIVTYWQNRSKFSSDIFRRFGEIAFMINEKHKVS